MANQVTSKKAKAKKSPKVEEVKTEDAAPVEATVDEAPIEAPKPKPKKKMYWGERTFHMKGLGGSPNPGDECTALHRKCWGSPLNIDNYLTDKPPVVETEEVE